MKIDRVGQGYDLHRLVAGRPFVLGGVTIEHDTGPLGHSDADVLAHAVIDALLGAVALGDIGEHFPDTDARYQGADSIVLLREAVALVRAHGYAVANCDCTVICERPKLGPHKALIAASLAAALGVTPAQVSVKAKTNEGVDAIGRGEAVAALAIVALARQ